MLSGEHGTKARRKGFERRSVMIHLSGFGDEISPDIEEQMKVMGSEKIRHIELRGVGGKNVLDLTDAELEEIELKMIDQDFEVSAIGSPIGKIRIDEDFDAHIERLKRAIEVAQFFETSLIRVFSFYPPGGAGRDIKKHRGEVIRRMEAMAALAEENDVVICHENEAKIYGEGPKECLDILKTATTGNLRAVFDPANFVLAGFRPYDDCWPLLRDYVEYFHIKDAKAKEKTIVAAGEGDGQIKSVLRDAVKREFEGFVSLEPHLAHAGQFQGFTGPELFVKAIRALKEILDSIGAEYDAK
jgi:sugar phosphate isomerase/epimerase